MKRPFVLLASVALGGVTAAQARADELACKPGVEETTFARATYALPAKNVHQLRGELEVWADEAGLNRGGTETYDPKTGIHTWTILVGPQGEGVSLSARFTTAARELELEAENLCWEEQTDWHPWWSLINKKLASWGYKKLP
jgi:hypothetical protein